MLIISIFSLNKRGASILLAVDNKKGPFGPFFISIQFLAPLKILKILQNSPLNKNIRPTSLRADNI
jgi:hypothetical protein